MKTEDSPVEQAYRAYLRAVKEAWANLDVEALDLKGEGPTPEALKSFTFFRLPWIPGNGVLVPPPQIDRNGARDSVIS